MNTKVDLNASFFDPRVAEEPAEFVNQVHPAKFGGGAPEGGTRAKNPDPPFVPTPRAKGKRAGGAAPQPRSTTMANVGAQTIQHTAPSAGGNLAHDQSNLLAQKWDQLLEDTRLAAASKAAGDEVRVQHLLKVFRAGFEGVIDNTQDKHGSGVDDAQRIAEVWYKSRNANVVFNPKADNQKKLISEMRRMIICGGWTKGGPQEPVATVNNVMGAYKKMRATEGPRMIDAGNFLLAVARHISRSDTMPAHDDLMKHALKPVGSVATIEDVLDATRRTLIKLQSGKHSAGQCATVNVDHAVKALNKELKAIADAKRAAETAAVGATIAAEADKQNKQTGVAAPAAA